MEQYDLETGFVAVVAAELPSGELECAQLSGGSYLKVLKKNFFYPLVISSVLSSVGGFIPQGTHLYFRYTHV